MPLVLAAAAFIGKQVIQIAVVLGVVELADRFVWPVLNSVVYNIQTAFGVDEDTAKDIVANEWIAFAEQIGVGAIVLKTRLPMRVADYLKFTTKGTAKRALPAATQAKVTAAKGAPPTAAATAAAGLELAGASIAANTGTTLNTVIKVLGLITGIIGTTSLTALTVAQWIDFGNWNSGAYQGTFNKLYAKFGLVPDQHQASPRVASQEMFDKVFNAMKNEGITKIRRPDTGEELPFTAPNAVLVIDKLASKLFITEGEVASKALLALALALTDFGTAAPIPGAAVGGSVAAAAAGVGAASPTQIQLYTGVISQGALGTPAEFIARPDDMIQDTEELKAAAKNNLAAFVQALPGNFYYEIAIVSSVKTRSGFTQRGEAVRIVTGYYKSGLPRYKTIYHKFAVMKVGVFDENRRTVRLATINLGPVNAVDFQPTNAQLTGVAGTITAELFTSNISDVAQINTPVAVVVNNAPVPPPPAPANQPTPAATPQPVYVPPTPAPPAAAPAAAGSMAGYNPMWEQYGLSPAQWAAYTPTQQARIAPAYAGATTPNPDFLRNNPNWKPYGSAAAPTPVPTPYVAPTLSALQLRIRAATNLSEYATATGTLLQPLNVRAVQYQNFGLGPASTYAGTAEQNNRLLVELKRSAGAL